MKYRATGFRGIRGAENLARSTRALLATTEFERTKTALIAEETATERELRLFLAGEIPFSDCQYVPAEYRVFEDPKFYGAPALTTSDDRHYMAGYANGNDVDDDFTNMEPELLATDDEDLSTTDVIEGDTPLLGWDFLDEWGDRQPACC